MLTDDLPLPGSKLTGWFRSRRWFRIPALKAILATALTTVSWLNVAILVRAMREAYLWQLRGPSRCGCGMRVSYSQFDPIWEVGPGLCLLNLVFWGLLVRFVPQHVRGVKLAALAAISVWLGVGGGILVGHW